MIEWLPIETCPKAYGFVALVADAADPDSAAVARWTKEGACGYVDNPPSGARRHGNMWRLASAYFWLWDDWCYVSGCSSDASGVIDFTPTHWAPFNGPVA